MRGTVAKRLRREIFGDLAQVPEYSFIKRVKKVFIKRLDKAVDKVTGQLVCKGKRGEYLKAKTEYNRGTR